MKNWTGEEESSKGAVVISGTSLKAQQKKFLKIHTLVETETTDWTRIKHEVKKCFLVKTAEPQTHKYTKKP